MSDQPVWGNLDFQGQGRIRNLPDGQSPQEPATVAQLSAAIEGKDYKSSARVATQGNINIAAPGATIDGVTLVTGDRVLVKSQSAPEENGIYVFDSATTPLVRSTDANTTELIESAFISVDEGTDEDRVFRQQEINVVIGTDPVVFSPFGTAAPSASTTVEGTVTLATQAEVNSNDPAAADEVVTVETLNGFTGKFNETFAASFGDGSATSFTLTHGLNTRDVVAKVYLNEAPFTEILTCIEHTDANNVTVNTAPVVATADQLRIVVQGTRT